MLRDHSSEDWGGWAGRGRTTVLAFHMQSFSLLSCPGRNEPLKKERLKWKSDYPMTDGQLRSKRDEFWQLSDPMDCSPPGSPVPGILQARTLEWVAISFSNA